MVIGGHMTDQQKLRRLLDEEVFPYELNPDWERVVNVKVVEAARKVANPDYQAALRMYVMNCGGLDPDFLEPDSIPEGRMFEVRQIVAAALGIDSEDTE
jgi:hypothetical protein